MHKPTEAVTKIHVASVVILSALLLFINGCALSPGFDTPQETDLDIQPITAELILEQQKLILSGVSSESAAALPSPSGKSYEYLIGSGDVLRVRVWDQQGFTFPGGGIDSDEGNIAVVDSEGTIFFPYIGTIKAAGKSVEALRELLTEKLQGVVVDPQIIVKIEEFRSKKVYVFGEVETPGVQQLNDKPVTILDALALAGGTNEEADLINATLTRADQQYVIDLLALYENGDIKQNQQLQDGDILYIPNADLHKIYVMGEVLRPASLPLTKRRLSLTEALNEVGNVSLTSANPARIYVIRGLPETTKVFHLDASSPTALILGEHFYLQPRDIVYVDTAGITRWSRFISQILPSVQFFGQPDVFKSLTGQQ